MEEKLAPRRCEYYFFVHLAPALVDKKEHSHVIGFDTTSMKEMRDIKLWTIQLAVIAIEN